MRNLLLAFPILSLGTCEFTALFIVEMTIWAQEERNGTGWLIVNEFLLCRHFDTKVSR
jgi:hypothetical protein